MVLSVEPTISRWRLYIAVGIVNLLFVSTGCVVTWPSPVLPKLRLPENEGAWISSAISLGGLLGPIINTLLMPYIGRKTILLCDGLIFLASWATLVSSGTYTAMIIGRVMGGIGVGISFVSVPLYITEVADDKVRQAVTSLTEFFIGLGYIVSYGMGPYLTYFQLQLASSGAVILFLVPILFLPESPYYLISKGEREKAAKSLAWFRGTDVSMVGHELDRIQESFSYKNIRTESSNLDVIKNKGFRKSLFLCVFVLFIQQLSGIGVVTSFTEPILAKANLPIAASTGAIAFGVVNLFSASFAPPIVRRFGTKHVLIFSNIIMALSLLSFSGYMYCNVHNIDVKSISLLPVIALVIYNIFFCIGGGPMPWSLIAEISPPVFRGFISCLTSTFSWIVSFGLMVGWAPASTYLGEWIIFGFFGVCLTIGTAVIAWALPDTRGLSLAQVQRLLAGEKEPKEIENNANG